jgi:hypothetical protein
MRLSVKKGAHHLPQEIRESKGAFRGFLSGKATPHDRYETTVIAKPL